MIFPLPPNRGPPIQYGIWEYGHMRIVRMWKWALTLRAVEVGTLFIFVHNWWYMSISADICWYPASQRPFRHPYRPWSWSIPWSIPEVYLEVQQKGPWRGHGPLQTFSEAFRGSSTQRQPEAPLRDLDAGWGHVFVFAFLLLLSSELKDVLHTFKGHDFDICFCTLYFCCLTDGRDIFYTFKG